VRKLAHLSLIVLATTAVVCSVWALVTVVERASLPYQVDYEEGNILNAAVRTTHGLSPYPDPHTLPSVINPYGPVLYLLESMLVKFFGLTFFPGRVLVIVSGIVTAIVIAKILHGETRSIAIGVAFGALFLGSPFVQFWWPLLRVDLVGLALTVAGVAIFHGNPRRVWMASVFFVIAVYTKHTLIAAPAACFVWALLNQQKKPAFKLFVACFVLGAITFTAGEIATHGVLAFALFLTHPDPYLWSAYPSALQQVAEVHSVLVVLAVVLLVGDVRQRKISLPLLYLIFAGIAVLTIGKAGSNSNHLLELVAALCLAGGAGYKYLVDLSGVRHLIPLTVALLIAVPLVDHSRALEFEPRSSACEQVINLIRQQPGTYVLSENTGAVVLAGKTPLVSNPFVYTQLVKYAGWSDHQLVNMLNQREVPLVLIDAARRQLWSGALMQSLHTNYRLSGHYDCRRAGLAFVPRPD
jgi:hypothetical protein